jgi:hypothetical protein
LPATELSFFHLKMADQALMNVIEENPIANGLKAFRDLYQTTCKRNRVSCTIDAFDQLELTGKHSTTSTAACPGHESSNAAKPPSISPSAFSSRCEAFGPPTCSLQHPVMVRGICPATSRGLRPVFITTTLTSAASDLC